MISREPTLERLAIAEGVLLAPFGLNEAALARALATIGEHRIETLAGELAALLPQRPLTLCRELTKQFETVHTLPAAELPAWLAADANRHRGEFVLVLHAPEPAAADTGLPSAATDMLAVLLRELPLKQAVSLAAELSAAPRNALYQAALRMKADAP